jgi:hypothetical protein
MTSIIWQNLKFYRKMKQIAEFAFTLAASRDAHFIDQICSRPQQGDYVMQWERAARDL